MPIIRFLVILFDRIFLILGVLVGAQIPLFMQQYIQRLSGHVAELNLFVKNLQNIASQSNKTLTQYIEKFQASSDPDFAKHGIFMSDVVKRQELMNEALQNLISSPTWQKLYFFIYDLQYQIAEKTWETFQPGLNLTLEGLGYMSLGGILFFCLYQLFIQFFISFYKLIKYCSKKLFNNFSKS